MRGRTLENAYVILDEAQNISADQLKMAMKRLGENTKFIILVDINQCDLGNKRSSGINLLNTLIQRGNIEFLSSIFLKENHRDPIVAELLKEFSAISNLEN